MVNQENWRLIQQYVTGNASADERRRLENWLDQHPDNIKVLREVEKIWSLTSEEDFDLNVESSWDQFRQSRMNRKPIPIRRTSRKSSGNLIYLYRAAAILLVTMITGYFVNQYTSNDDASRQVADFLVMENMETGKGEKARVTFSDGTEVTLNSAGSVSFPKEFRGTKREIYLDGEAYFKVMHDPDRPFIVHTQGVEVQVLGTEFNVRGWSEDSSVDVVVREGKVSVNATNPELVKRNGASIILTEGLFTSVRRGQLPEPAQEVDVVKHLLWRNGGLHFDSVPFNKVTKEIERRFNVQISMESSQELLDTPYTGTFQYARLDEILSVISVSMEIGYRRDGSNIIFN